MSAFKYRAFISYSHRDTGWATWLHRGIENYRPPRNLVGREGMHGPVPPRLSPVFRDREELPSATNLGNVISQALADSACQLVICSPDAARSKWVNEEILAFKRLGREDRILCIIIGGEPNASDVPGRESEECFPQALRFKLGADGELSSERTEPIAADARPGKDGKANARLKLIAGMLGVGFDALKQREQARRQRRLAAVATAATFGMVLTTGLAAMALLARAEAEKQAERALQTTVFLTDLFRVSDPNDEARAKTITAGEILDRGARRIETELAGQPEVQASLMDTIGNVYTNMGLLEQARPLLEAALRRRREMLGGEHLDTAATEANLANWLRLESDYEAAEDAYRDALAVQRRELGDEDPVVATSLVGLAEVLAEAGNYEEAETTLREALDIRRAAYGEEHPDVARALEDLALVLGQQGDLDAAIPMLEDAVAMERRIWGDEPKTYLAEALNNLGILLYAQGNYERTEALFRESLAMNQELYGEGHYDLAAGINNLAFLLHDQGDLAQAETMYREVLDILAGSSGTDTPAYAIALNNLAYVLYDEGEKRAALDLAQSAADIYATAFPEGHPDYADTLAGIGAWRLELGEPVEAEVAIRAGLAMRETLLGRNHPDFANSQVQLAMLQVAAGQFDEALGLVHEAQGTLAAGLPEGHWRRAVADAIEGAALAGLHNYTEAEPLLREADAILASDPGALLVYVSATRRYLYELYSAWGRPEDASPYADDTPAVSQL